LVLVVGKRDQGKTALLRRYVENREPRVLALDPFGDFRGLMRTSSENAAIDLIQYATACRRRLVPPIRGSRTWSEKLFDRLGDRGAPADYLLVLDEITLWSQKKETEPLERLVLQGRRLGIRLLVACQKVALVPDVLLSEATQLVVFHVSRPRDIDVLNEWDDGLGDAARELPPRRCIYIDV
jgi:hypothetical protein